MYTVQLRTYIIKLIIYFISARNTCPLEKKLKRESHIIYYKLQPTPMFILDTLRKASSSPGKQKKLVYT